MNTKSKFFLGLCLLLSFFISFSSLYAQESLRDIYEIKIYSLDNQEQADRVDNYLKEAYIPALHRAGIEQVGVFKPIEGDSLYGKSIYVLVPYLSAEQLISTPAALENDQEYQTAGKDYIEALHNKPPYSRIQTIVLQAFEGMSRLQSTNLDQQSEDRIYELRSYESATEKLFRNKVDMFNKGEIEIFQELEFNPVFFGEVVAGPNMPNLMYMTAFEDMEARDEHWKAFGDDPAWKEMSAMEEYQNNVSHIDILFLKPTPYSEI